MARPGVTYSEVAEAAAHLVGQGKNPTIEQIRLFIGSGSSTTIANHMKHWKEQQQGSGLLAAKENIPQELVEIVKGLWGRVVGIAEENVSALEMQLNNKIAQLEQDVEKYKTNNQRWQQLFLQWQKEKTQLLVEKTQREEEIAALQATNASLKSTIEAQHTHAQEKEARVHELQRLHQQVQANLEHYRESVREQRVQELQQYEQQKQELQSDIKVLRTHLATAQEKFAQLQQSHNLLERNSVELKGQIEKIQNAYTMQEKNLHDYQKQSEHWQHQCHEGQKNLVGLQADNKSYQRELADAKVMITKMKEAAITRKKRVRESIIA